MFHVFLILTLTAFFSACGGDATSTADTTTNTDTTVTDTTGTDSGTTDTTGTDTASNDSGSSTDTNACVPQCDGKQCGPNGCGGTCGICGPGKTCTADGVCEIDVQGTVPFGGECIITADCASKEPDVWDWTTNQAGIQTYLQCLDKQCMEGTCSIPFGTPVCIKNCTLSAADDQSNNNTGAPEPDGVEDGNVLCAGADPEGPFGTNYRCVRLTDPVGGNDASQCVAGTDFKECTANEDCPVGESCQIQQILGVNGSFCMSSYQGGAGVSEFCENNPHNPAVYYNDDLQHCADTFCYGIGIGCTTLCGKADPNAPGTTIPDDSVCLTEGAVCDGGKCANNADVDCAADVDCSAWLCDAGSQLSAGPPPLVKDVCFPKECSLNEDCVDDNFFCRTFYNGEDTPETAGWEHMCLRKPVNTVPVGEACDENPNDQIPGPVCSNPIWCQSGQCSTHCADDAQCGTEQACGVVEIPIQLTDPNDVDDEVLNANDAFLPLGVCVNQKHTGELTECTKDADCTNPGEACASNTFAKGDGTFEVKYQCLAGPSATATGTHGDTCGGDSGVSCINGTCINFTMTDGSSQGACLSTCRSADDCVQGPFLGGGDYKGICRNIRAGWNGTADLRDDLYIPSCLPSAAEGNSLSDCSGSAQWVGNPSLCGADEACLAFGISVNPGEPSVTDFRCLNYLDANGAPPPKAVGESCDPAATTDECASLFCEPLAVGGICSKMCDPAAVDSCSDVPNTSCSRRVLVPRLLQENEAAVYTCRPTDASCVACSAHSDCSDGHACLNVGTGLNTKFRCVEDCSDSAVCGNAGACSDATDNFGEVRQGCETTCQ
jgi:hypothetical protein